MVSEMRSSRRSLNPRTRVLFRDTQRKDREGEEDHVTTEAGTGGMCHKPRTPGHSELQEAGRTLRWSLWRELGLVDTSDPE